MLPWNYKSQSQEGGPFSSRILELHQHFNYIFYKLRTQVKTHLPEKALLDTVEAVTMLLDSCINSLRL
jgi:hypothetical protein